jgi:hypothetical protein
MMMGFVRGAVVEMIAENWKDHPDTLPCLKHACRLIETGKYDGFSGSFS